MWAMRELGSVAVNGAAGGLAAHSLSGWQLTGIG